MSFEEKTNNNGVEKVSLYKLFLFADRLDIGLMTAGTLGAIANGLSQPLMAFIFSQLINSFATVDSSHVIHETSKVNQIWTIYISSIILNSVMLVLQRTL